MDISCSARIVQPFLKLATAQAAYRDLVPPEFWEADADARVSLEATQSMLVRGVERLRDEQLGLRLGCTMSLGSGGVFDYAVRSSRTFGESLVVASTYSKLLTDSFTLSCEPWRRQVLLRLEDGVGWPRAAADFAMSALYKLHIAEHVPAQDLEVWFPYAAPQDTSEYQRIFNGAELKFSSPCNGFAFHRSLVEAPMPGADAALHAILISRVEALLGELSASRSFSVLVRRLVAEGIRSGDTSAERVARGLRISRRTLSRRLERERTSFDALLDDARRALAVESVRTGKLSLTEVAFLSGFAHVESFHRAFKRWTGFTPAAYRKGESEPPPPMASTQATDS
ncbi:MAG TPA: AraC family transcriptional regulator ligand-binding domain-containing protein [Polyangiaceae bacterium]|jgi:AraC-like DNA-binding protein|nr:AraC family transcriptional regulator ligand-binding domain-containing protein [Polyangiaceae bacterium]